MTWIEVADSAVKIGLGALIGGAASYLSTRMTHDRGARAEYAKRRRDLLEKVLEMMNHFEKKYRHQKALFDSLSQALAPDERTEMQAEFNKMDQELRVEFEGFADASGILLMLGASEAELLLDEYREATNDWYDRSFPGRGAASGPSLDELREKIIAKRGAVMAALAELYRTT